MNKVIINTSSKAVIYLLSLFFVCYASISMAKEDTSYRIPYLDDAKIFAELTDELPAVVNYFTQRDKQEIIDFYQEQYGEAISSETKRSRLTLHFAKDQQKLRVIISKQGDRYQVDALRQ